MNPPCYNDKVDITDPSFDPLAHRTHELVGSLCVCSIGIVGKVEGRAFTSYGKWAWVGTSIHGRPWSSTRPTPLSKDDVALIEPLFRSSLKEVSLA